jgi:hypothetical protein
MVLQPHCSPLPGHTHLKVQGLLWGVFVCSHLTPGLFKNDLRRFKVPMSHCMG